MRYLESPSEKKRAEKPQKVFLFFKDIAFRIKRKLNYMREHFFSSHELKIESSYITQQYTTSKFTISGIGVSITHACDKINPVFMKVNNVKSLKQDKNKLLCMMFPMVMTLSVIHTSY